TNFLFLFLFFRFPLRRPTRHGSILSRESPADKKQKVERCISAHDFDPTDSSSRKTKCSSDESRSETYGLVQRCVIIQRDENGFGLTVSGDNPVFVQSVKEGESSWSWSFPVPTSACILVKGCVFPSFSSSAGSYVALTVQGRPPGSPQIPLADSELDPAAFGHMSPIMTSPHSPGASGNTERITSPVLMGEENNIVHSQKVEILRKMLQKEQERLQSLQEDYSRSPASQLLKEIQEAKKHIPQLQEQLSKATGSIQVMGISVVLIVLSSLGMSLQISEIEAERGDGLNRGDGSFGDSSHMNSDTAEVSPFSKVRHHLTYRVCLVLCFFLLGKMRFRVLGPDYSFLSVQINGQCSCFQNIELLKSRPAHLAVFLHHVVSQFDPASLLCYLFADLYKQTNSKETRRVFAEFNQFFLDKSANLKVPIPDEISVDLEKRRLDLIPEELHRHYIHTMQEKVLPEVHRHLEDFRQKRSMGLTLAEGELTRLDAERIRDRTTQEKERVCAEQIISKIEEVLMTSQPIEEEKSSSIQYVVLTYMKHLGVRVKEPRSLDQKRGRIGFLPKIKQSIKKEKEGDEKKRRVFPNILGPPRRPSRHDSYAIGRAMEIQKQRHPKHLSSSSSISPEPPESARMRQSSSIESTDAAHPPANLVSPLAAGSSPSQEGSKDSEAGSKQVGETPPSGDSVDGTPRTTNTIFDFPSPPLDHLLEEEGDFDRLAESGTPKSFRKMDSVGAGDIQSEDELFEFDMETDPPNWQQLVSREVLLGLKPSEIKRQEVINELFYTERAHVRTLKVLDQVFYQRVSREGILPHSELRKIFSNLEDILQLHAGLNEQMKAVRKRNETSVIDQIGEDLLTWFSGAGEDKLKQATATFCSNQPFALEVIKSRQKKDSRFQTFVQDAESNPLCRRLQLKDIIPTEMQRLTKYPLLLDNIAKYSEQPGEKEKVKKAADHCRQILNFVNQAVKEAENKQHLEDYQRRLDLSYLKQLEGPMLEEFRNLDLTRKKMIHEGPLTWKVNRDKTIDLYTLLLEDILVLLQKQDDRLVLRCHSKILANAADSKHTFSPVIKLNTVLVRQVATDNKAFFVISMSENGAHIYELVAQTVSEKTVWQELIARMAGTVKVGRRVIPLHPPGPYYCFLLLISASPRLGAPQHSRIPDISDLWELMGVVIQNGRVPSLNRLTIFCSLSVGLLKKLLMQQLGMTEQESPEDRQRFSRHRAVSQGVQVEKSVLRGQQHSEKDRASLPGVSRMPSGMGTSSFEPCSGHRTSGEFVQVGDTTPNSSQLTDPLSTNPETPIAELEGVTAEDGGEHFFDAREAHSDENHSEGEVTERKDVEEVQLRISGNFLILDDYGAAQESSTDEEVASLVLRCTAGKSAMDSAPQAPASPQEAQQPDPGASSPFAAREVEPSHWEATKEPSSSEVLRPPFSPESRSLIMHYIQKIEANLEHLKVQLLQTLYQLQLCQAW
uniref:Rho guanine nucleotide exchange factor 12 n=1 Tax=Anolis carolinensis TaxID=28377 RepID=A0A803TYQ3_ANOCA